MIVETEITYQEAFFVSGIAVRTRNKDGQSQNDIGDLWAKFMKDNVSDRMGGKLSDEVYCVYTEYESDYNGLYTALLGYKVSDVKASHEFTTVTIPSSKYMLHYLEGEFPDMVGDAWQEIWQQNAERRYTTDFDVYDFNSKGAEGPAVKIYLAIK